MYIIYINFSKKLQKFLIYESSKNIIKISQKKKMSF